MPQKQEATMKTGRKAVILSITLDKPRPFEQILNLLEENASNDCDLMLLPEICLGNDNIIAMNGEEIQNVAAIAKKHRKYIVFPVFRKTDQARRLNSAILFDRYGNIKGVYDKIYPYWEEFYLTPPATPGNEAYVFETDFGKIGMAICFDVNFPDIWKRLRQKGAELVLWPSAYSAGTSLQAHALNYNVNIITSTLRSDCLVYDITGKEVFYGKNEGAGVYRNEIDLDRCIFHQDFTYEKRERLLREHPDEIEMDCLLEKEGWFTLRAIKEGVSARALAREYGLEELYDYKARSEREIDLMREEIWT